MLFDSLVTYISLSVLFVSGVSILTILILRILMYFRESYYYDRAIKQEARVQNDRRK